MKKLKLEVQGYSMKPVCVCGEFWPSRAEQQGGGEEHLRNCKKDPVVLEMHKTIVL